MKHYIKTSENSDYFSLFVENFDSNLKIDLKKQDFIFIESIVLTNDNFNIVFNKDPNTDLFVYAGHQHFNKNLNFNLVLEDLYLWIRDLEIKYYGRQILDYCS